MHEYQAEHKPHVVWLEANQLDAGQASTVALVC